MKIVIITLIGFHQKMFKTVLNKNTGEKIEVPAKILRHSFRLSLCLSMWNFVMILRFYYCWAKLDKTEWKTRRLKEKRMNHILQKFTGMYQRALHWVFLIQKKLSKESEYFSYRGEILRMYLLKRWKKIYMILQIFINKNWFLQNKIRRNIAQRKLIICVRVNVIKIM